MKLILQLIFSLLVFSGSLFGQITKHVLFLGNSYTDVNSLPTIIANLAQSTGDSLVYSQNTPGGYTLQGHSTNPTSLNLIKQGNWDYVVLQEQSQKPSWPIAQVISSVFPYAKILCDSIRSANSCTTPLFYMTWGRKNGDSYNCANWPPVCTYQGMDSLLNLRYRMMADSNAALVSPVGAVWHYIRDHYNKIELYAADESHPSVAGSYAAACTFYSLIFQKDPSLITNDYGIDPVDAANIRNTAKLIAFDSLSKWNVGKFTPKAKFTNTQNNDTIFFVNQSQYADSYLWNFGDGNSSTVFEPIHKYSKSGNYHVMLDVARCGVHDTISKNIQVTISAIQVNEKVVSRVFPNPIQNQINIQLQNTQTLNNIELYSTDGRIIKSFGDRQGTNIMLKANSLVSGFYILKFEIDGILYQYKILKQ